MTRELKNFNNKSIYLISTIFTRYHFYNKTSTTRRAVGSQILDGTKSESNDV
jgi:hypothetical protein